MPRLLNCTERESTCSEPPITASVEPQTSPLASTCIQARVWVNSVAGEDLGVRATWPVAVSSTGLSITSSGNVPIGAKRAVESRYRSRLGT